MIAPKNSIDSQSTDTPLPNSKKIYVGGKIHSEICVPFREISLAPTKSMNGEIEVNEPVRVYDTSGPWGDPNLHLDVTRGLPPVRAKWIRDRGDVKECEGRKVQPIDDGWLSERMRTENVQRPTSNAQRRSQKAATARTIIRRSMFGVRRLAFLGNLCAAALAILSRSSGTRGRESSHRKWNSSQ